MSQRQTEFPRLNNDALRFAAKYIVPASTRCSMASELPPSEDTASVSATGRLLPIWAEAKSSIDRQIGALETFLKTSGAPVLERIAETGLHGVTSGQIVSLQAALMDFDAAATPVKSARLPALSSALKGMATFVQSDEAVGLMDSNPFKIDCTIRATTLAALSEIAQAAKRIVAEAEG